MPHRVLVIDDDLETTRGLERLLSANGFLVRTENDSSKALAAAREFQPDTVILDFLMPTPHGGEVAWQLASDAQLKCTPRIVLCSGVSTEQFALNLPPIKIVVLEKPVIFERLLPLLGASLPLEQVV